MSCVLPLAVLLPVVLAAQPMLPPEVSYSRQPYPALAPPTRPDQPGVEAYSEAESLLRSNLVGTWQAVYFEHDGQSQPEVAAGLQMKFSRGRLELLQTGRPPLIVAYNVNPSKSPAGFLWKLPYASSVTFQDGIYHVSGNRLAICLSAINTPPAWKFLTQPGDGKTLFVLERSGP